MPFEPKLYDDPPGHEPREQVPNWDDAEQLDLPDDLAMLAEQLRDDANYLARQHPADATPAQRQAAWEAYVADDKSKIQRVAGFPWRWMSAAAAAVLIAVAGGALALHVMDESTDVVHPLAETNRQAESLRASAQNPKSNRDLVSSEPPTPRDGSVHPANSAADELPSDAPRLIPATFLRDVSAPELDGVLDLLEGEESGLSI